MYFMLKSIYVSIQLQEHGRVHVCNVTIRHASCVILKFINQSLYYVMVIVYFFLHAHADEPPVVSLTVKIRDGFKQFGLCPPVLWVRCKGSRLYYSK